MLIQCDPNLFFGCNTALIADHFMAGFITPDGVCQEQTAINLDYCGNARYACIIVDGPNTPSEDAFIEWYWAIEYPGLAQRSYITGKFTFCANATYILNTWTANGGGYGGLVVPGIPMFNQSNHNV